MTTWTATCAWCRQTFTADKPRPYCSRPCYDRHRWYGVVPDGLRRTYEREVEWRGSRGQSNSQDLWIGVSRDLLIAI